MQPLTQTLMCTRHSCELQFIISSSMMTYSFFRFHSNNVQIPVKIMSQVQDLKRTDYLCPVCTTVLNSDRSEGVAQFLTAWLEQ